MNKKELIDNMCEMVKYILPEEEHDNDVIANYTDSLVMIAEEYHTEQLTLADVSNNEVALKAFVEEFVEAWEDGMGGDSSLYDAAKRLL